MKNNNNGQEKEKWVLPGDFIANAEEYLPGQNAMELDGSIVSLASGSVVKDDRRLVVSVITDRKMPKIRIDDIVYGQVTKADRGKYKMKAGVLVDRETGDLVEINRDANIHIEGSRDSALAPVRVGDYVRARVINVRRDIDVSIGGKHLGVVMGMCSKCRNPLVLKGKTLYCPNCETTETRKIADDFGKVYMNGEKHES
ncbi:MAG: exosome complex RNA-binding protein Csl4 [Candidatus Thermoplasmatota archaeon]|nr:exosome complex RNA-binding protein Csl4 [Candidatus Thermoplasmatota archaeon]MCL5666092.1 exosome complex RNA-binding protein Csl4 [Candidatus Thermoplasmatota archaeon]